MTARSVLFSKGVSVQRSHPILIGIKNRRRQMGLLMLAADLLGFATAVGSVLVANGFVHLFLFQLSDLKYSVILFICLLLFMNSRLYPGVGINPAEEIKLVTQYTSTSFIIGMILFSAIQISWQPNVLAFFAVGSTSLLTILLARWGTRIVASQLGLWGEPVVVFGTAKQATELSCYFCQRRRLGFVPLIATNDTIRRKCATCPIPVINLDDLLASHADRFLDQGIHTVLVDSSSAASISGMKASSELLRLFQHVTFVSDMDWLGGASISIHDYEGLMGIEAHKHKLNALDTLLKRGMDILFGVLIGVLSLPIMLAAAILIRLDSAGAIFYKQERLGKKGRVIKIYKFRTMVTDGDCLLTEYLESHPEARLEWDQSQKLRQDPRITRVGRFLRKFSIDELPQLYNVIKGDMSLVGPRPIMMDQMMLYGDRIEAYCGVRPGLTGFWQVSGRNHTTFEKRIHYDVYYVKNWSVWLDLYILLRTVWVALSRDGAY
ncbi:MAG: undecaprenyl-phosphate galactose phosphotransferase WbaP [Chloroflexi bacterium]|nr:MAG: undecaprenyl-phosphate galactose phosphotransferase WbaP [Chloroflexota bacterium]